jgi:hypothetical protein
MSICKNYYVISGYDLTGYETDKFDDWKWTNDGEKYHCYQSKGNIQLFYDPMCGDHLYFGYILAAGDQYCFETTKFSTKEIERQMYYVSIKLHELVNLGVISEDVWENIRYDIIAFEECT